jgi:DNA-binding NtrC family response regulator
MANECILVVETDVLIRLAISNHLRETGFVVVEAASADDAWAFMSVEGVVDLVFAEIATPGVLDGLALAKLAAARFMALPFLLTGEAGRPPPPGPWTFVAKPYAPERVTAAIAEALGLNKPKDEP